MLLYCYFSFKHPGRSHTGNTNIHIWHALPSPVDLFTATVERNKLFNCYLLGQDQYHHCRCGFGELNSSHPMLLWTASGCELLLLLEISWSGLMMLIMSAADQPVLTGSLQRWGALHPAEQVTAVCSNVVQCWEAETSLWVPQLRELLPSSLWELSSFSKWKLRIWMCEQCLPGKAFDLPWVSQQEEFSSLELLPDSDHGTLNFLLCWADFVTSLTLSTDCFVTA